VLKVAELAAIRRHVLDAIVRKIADTKRDKRLARLVQNGAEPLIKRTVGQHRLGEKGHLTPVAGHVASARRKPA
jgi:hypothetical protein